MSPQPKKNFGCGAFSAATAEIWLWNLSGPHQYVKKGKWGHLVVSFWRYIRNELADIKLVCVLKSAKKNNW